MQPEQPVEVVGERLEALLQQLVRDLAHVHAGVAELAQRPLGLGHRRRRDRGLRGAVIGERAQGLLRHRVHGVRRRQPVDVHHVGVRRVLRRRRRPQRALHARAGRGEPLPAAPAEELLEAPVGDARVGDAGLPAQRRVVRQHPVDLGVDARHEERRDAPDAVDRLPGSEPALEAAQVRLGDLDVAFDAEQQRDVDVDAVGDQLLHGADADLRARHLDHDVGPVERAEQPAHLADEPVVVVLHAGRRLVRDEAVLALRRVVLRAEGVGRGADVVDRERKERLVRVVLAGAGELLQRFVVVRGAGDGLREDGGVGGQARDPAVVDVALQVARLDERAADEVEPGALTE